ncbi:coiled-coil domain-containing protein [Methylobacter psychrophilus]|uniref:hypothetical protein n=1 Tax=Methylobacter psychrophilus TaxID=96941 RepID=UPI0021D4F8EE|nr:hypothetical protein [Methylobacter psychrophilus]
METYLPIIKATISDWILLAQNNPLYTLAIAILAWLLTAIIYSIKIGSLKNQIIVSENSHLEEQNKLNSAINAAQQQTQQMQQELAANTEQMQKDRQSAQNEAERAEKIEEQLSQRNKEIAGVIQTLAASFDLGERPVPLMGDIKADGLWQQHDRVINLLTTRLRSEQQAKAELQQSFQAETARRVGTEALIDTLQTILAAQTSQISKLEQAFEEQKLLLQQQQDQAQQVLSKTLEKHLSELARLTELEQQTLDLVNTKQQLTHLEEKITTKDTLIAQLEKTKSVDPVKGQAQPALVKPDEKETSVELKNTAEVISPAPTVVVAEQLSVSPVKQPADETAEKSNSLFGKTVPEPVKAEPEVIAIKQNKPEAEPAPAKQQPESPAKSRIGKLKNLFGSTSQKPIKVDPVFVEKKQVEEKIQPAPVATESLPFSATKNQFGNKNYFFGDVTQPAEEIKQEEAKVQPASATLEQPPATPAKAQIGKLKSLFGSKQQPEETKQAKAETQPAPAPLAVEQPPVIPAKGQLGKLKSLFGKIK